MSFMLTIVLSLHVSISLEEEKHALRCHTYRQFWKDLANLAYERERFENFLKTRQHLTIEEALSDIKAKMKRRIETLTSGRYAQWPAARFLRLGIAP